MAGQVISNYKQLERLLLDLPDSDPGGDALYFDNGVLTKSGVAVDPSLIWDFAGTKALAASVGPTPTLTRASVGTYLNASGVIVEAAIDTPRFHHYYIGGQIVSAGLLLEPERENKFIVSRLFTNENWAKNNVTLTGGQADLYGGSDAFLVTDSNDGSAELHRWFQAVNVTDGLQYCASIFVKPGTVKKLLMQCGNPLAFYVMFDLENGVAGIDPYFSGVGEIEEYPGGWFRCSDVVIATGTGAQNIQFWMSKGGEDYQGDATGTMTIDSAQFEQGDAPSMPIYTTAPTVTRAADIVSVSGAPFTGIYTPQTTAVVEVRKGVPQSGLVLSIDDTTADNMAELSLVNNRMVGSIASGGVGQLSLTSSGKVLSGRTTEKLSLTMEANSATIAKAGLVEPTDTSVTLPVSPTRLRLGAFNGCVGKLTLTPQRKSNSAMSTATAPVLITAQLHNLILDGNSLTSGFGSPLDSSYPAQMMKLLGDVYRHVTVHMIAVGGQRTTAMNADRVSQVNPLIVDGHTLIVAWEITNHLVDLVTARTAVDEMWVYCDAVRALGAKVIVPNVLPRVEDGTIIPAGFNTSRASANGLLAAEWASHADGYVDLAAIGTIGDDADAADTNYYTDGSHMTPSGYGIVAAAIKTAVETLVAAW